MSERNMSNINLLNEAVEAAGGTFEYTMDANLCLNRLVNALQNGGGGGGGTITVDKEMSDTSTHAVQNKVIKAYVDSKSGGGGDYAVVSKKAVTNTITYDSLFKVKEKIESGEYSNVFVMEPSYWTTVFNEVGPNHETDFCLGTEDDEMLRIRFETNDTEVINIGYMGGVFDKSIYGKWYISNEAIVYYDNETKLLAVCFKNIEWLSNPIIYKYSNEYGHTLSSFTDTVQYGCPTASFETLDLTPDFSNPKEGSIAYCLPSTSSVTYKGIGLEDCPIGYAEYQIKIVKDYANGDTEDKNATIVGDGRLICFDKEVTVDGAWHKVATNLYVKAVENDGVYAHLYVASIGDFYDSDKGQYCSYKFSVNGDYASQGATEVTVNEEGTVSTDREVLQYENSAWGNMVFNTFLFDSRLSEADRVKRYAEFKALTDAGFRPIIQYINENGIDNYIFSRYTLQWVGAYVVAYCLNGSNIVAEFYAYNNGAFEMNNKTLLTDSTLKTVESYKAMVATDPYQICDMRDASIKKYWVGDCSSVGNDRPMNVCNEIIGINWRNDDNGLGLKVRSWEYGYSNIIYTTDCWYLICRQYDSSTSYYYCYAYLSSSDKKVYYAEDYTDNYGSRIVSQEATFSEITEGYPTFTSTGLIEFARPYEGCMCTVPSAKAKPIMEHHGEGESIDISGQTSTTIYYKNKHTGQHMSLVLTVDDGVETNEYYAEIGASDNTITVESDDNNIISSATYDTTYGYYKVVVNSTGAIDMRDDAEEIYTLKGTKDARARKTYIFNGTAWEAFGA